MRLVSLIKQAGLDAMEAGKPVAVVYGTVESVSPLQIDAGLKVSIDAEFLILPEHLTPYSITIGSETREIRRGLQAGDKVVLIRAQGGQQYLIMDRVVEA